MVDVTVPITYASGAPYTLARTTCQVQADTRLRADDTDSVELNAKFDLPNQRGVQVPFSVPVRQLVLQDRVAVTTLPYVVGASQPRKANVRRKPDGDIEVTYPEAGAN